MRHRQALAGLVVAAVVALPLAPPASATATFAGRKCTFDGSRPNSFTVSGTVEGGPYVGADTSNPLELAEVYLFCSLQVGGNGTHVDPDAVHLETEGDGVAYLPPTAVQFDAFALDTVFLCTEIWIFTGDGHLTVYATGSTYSTSPNVACDVALAPGVAP